MSHTWGMDYGENGVVSRGNLYIINESASVKPTPDAPTLAVCMPSRGSVPVEVFMAMKRLALPINTQCMFLYTRGMMGTSGRDSMTQQCMRMGVDYIYYADDDVLPPPNVLYKMMMEMSKDETIGLITGVYTTKSVPPHPHIYKDENKGAYWGFSLSPYDAVEDIWGCGAGCIMVRTAAMRNWKQPYWTEKLVNHNDHQVGVLGHDLYFCERIREAGYRTVVDGSIQCDHFDTHEEKYYRLPKNSPPIRRFRQDPRNDDYWMNWWGVTPHGAGRMYREILEYIQGAIESTDYSDITVIGSGGGAAAQSIHNMMPFATNFHLMSNDEVDHDWAKARFMRCDKVTVPEDGLCIMFEPSFYGFDDEFMQACVANTDLDLLIVDTKELSGLGTLKYSRQGDWHVYQTISADDGDCSAADCGQSSGVSADYVP